MIKRFFAWANQSITLGDFIGVAFVTRVGDDGQSVALRRLLPG